MGPSLLWQSDACYFLKRWRIWFSTHASEIMPTFLWLMYHICVESNIFPEIFSKYSGFSLPMLQLSYVSNCLSIYCRNEEPVWAFLIISIPSFQRRKAVKGNMWAQDSISLSPTIILPFWITKKYLIVDFFN